MAPAGGTGTLQPCSHFCNRLHPEHVRLALLHELLQAINAFYSGGTTAETALEEWERKGLANGVLQVLWDNPGFTDYLMDRNAGAKGGTGHMNGTGPRPAPALSRAPDHYNDH